LQTFDFHGVIGQHAHRQDAQILEDEGGRRILTLVGFVPYHQIGIDGVIAHILEVIGPQLVEDTDPASLLAQVDQNPSTFFGDHMHGLMQLRPTVATQRAQDIAGETFGVHTHQHILASGDIADEQDEMFLIIQVARIQI
jgi:hypothetical protein